jgi:tight adherence protein C
MTGSIVGGFLGLMVGGGCALVWSRLIASRRPSLEIRVLPYLRDVPASGQRVWSRPPSDSPIAALAAVLRPALDEGAQRLERIVGGNESIRRRLERAGSKQTVEQFRVSQLEWGIAAFVITAVVGLLGPANRPDRAVPWLLVCCATAILGIMLRENQLSGQVRSRESRMLAEFPVVADLLALAVAAGEGPIAALDRVVRTCRGELPAELGRVLAESRSGTPIADALDNLASRSGLPIVSRFADGISVALNRGTPLADVLTAQAADVREAAKRELIEIGARKEVAMMVPVVFLLLPVTLLFAFYPGVIGLRLIAP